MLLAIYYFMSNTKDIVVFVYIGFDCAFIVCPTSMITKWSITVNSNIVGSGGY